MGCPPCKKGAPLWLLTFGDMMSLLLVFFILLLSFASMDAVKFKDAAGSLKDAFGVQSMQMINPVPTGEQVISMAFTQEVILVHLVEKLNVLFARQVDNGEAEIIEDERGFTIRMQNDRLFNRETNTLTREASEILQSLANLLVGIPNIIYIMGHTDNVPPNPNGAFPSNWAVAAAQSAAVINFLATKGGVEAVRLQVRAMGEFDPVASNENEEGRAKNRRLEVLISRETPSISAAAKK